jgi:hypothetical protein
MQSVLPTPMARPTALLSSTWRSLGQLPQAPGTSLDPRCCSTVSKVPCPVLGDIALCLWTAVWFLQFKAGEDAVHP